MKTSDSQTLENIDILYGPATKKTSCREKVLNMVKHITVEPVAFFSMFTIVLAGLCTQTLALEKTCRVSLELGDEICYSLRIQNQSNDFSAYEKMVQEHYSTRIMWKSVLQSLLPCILLLYVGGWSDKTGRRKIIMFIPIIGGILQSTSNIINVIFFYQLPLDVLIFFDVFFINITGGSSVMFLALFNYICDITTAENRTHRTGIFNLCTYAGVPLGLGLSGVLLKHVGYLSIYGFCLTVDVSNLIYVSLRLSDRARTEEQLAYDRQGLCKFLRTFFDLTSIRDTVGVVFKKTKNNRALHLCLLFGMTVLLNAPMYVDISVGYIATRYRFNWDELMFSIFQTYSFVLSAVGTISTIIVLCKILKWHDSVMGIISTISIVAGACVYAFAPNERIFLIGPLVSIFSGTSAIAVKSIYTKLLQPNEIGKVNSLVGLLDTLTPLLFISLYTKVYTMTMDALPGTVYLVYAIIVAPTALVFIWLLFEHKKDVRRDEIKTILGSNVS